MKKCKLCGKKFDGRSDKIFCCDNHRVAYYRMVNKPHYLELNRKHQRDYRERNRVVRWCKFCGLELIGKKRSYCNKKCEIKYKLKLGHKSEKWKMEEKYVPLYCDECGNRAIVMSDGVVVCRVCGLVL